MDRYPSGGVPGSAVPLRISSKPAAEKFSGILDPSCDCREWNRPSCAHEPDRRLGCNCRFQITRSSQSPRQHLRRVRKIALRCNACHEQTYSSNYRIASPLDPSCTKVDYSFSQSRCHPDPVANGFAIPFAYLLLARRIRGNYPSGPRLNRRRLCSLFTAVNKIPNEAVKYASRGESPVQPFRSHVDSPRIDGHARWDARASWPVNTLHEGVMVPFVPNRSVSLGALGGYQGRNCW